MQEIHSIGGGGRFFGGGGGDRRLRPHHHQNHQALKCPRCDSLNTKFCYYNNYNLSQPRHFCKNCRRYWTKGGVLRNVPVGGGCRKSKRSNKPKHSSSSETTAEVTTSTSQPPEPERKSNSHSSSESSSLTAANTPAAAATATEAVSAATPNSDSNNLLENMQESKLLIHQSSSNPGLEVGALEQGAGDCGIFSEIGSFTSLITSSANDALGFGFGNITSPFRFGTQQGSDPLSGGAPCEWQQQMLMSMGGECDHHHHQDLKLPEITAGSLLDHTVPVDLSALHNKTGHGGFGPSDWQSGADQGWFDLPNTVDQPYWSQTHWSDQDNPTLFHHP